MRDIKDLLNVRVEGGKYTIVQNEHGQLRVDRGEIRGWIEDPPGGKMLIALASEVEAARKLITDIAESDKCEPQMLTRIQNYMETYRVEPEDSSKGIES